MSSWNPSARKNENSSPLQLLFTSLIMRNCFGGFFAIRPLPAAMEAGVGFMRAMLVDVVTAPLAISIPCMIWERWKCYGVSLENYTLQVDSYSKASLLASSTSLWGDDTVKNNSKKMLSTLLQRKSMRKPWKVRFPRTHLSQRGITSTCRQQAGEGVYVIYHQRERRQKQTIPHRLNNES